MVVPFGPVWDVVFFARSDLLLKLYVGHFGVHFRNGRLSGSRFPVPRAQEVFRLKGNALCVKTGVEVFGSGLSPKNAMRLVFSPR